MARNPQTRSLQRSGSAAVELAFILPLLVMLMLGIWEVGRMIEVNQIMSNAAREGARQASNANKTSAEIEAIVIAYLSNCGINTANCTVKVNNLTTNPTPDPLADSDEPTAATQLNHLRVTVTLPFNNVKWVFVNQVITNATDLSAFADWFCMRDQPLTIDPSMPVN